MILITGGTGFVGQVLVRHLMEMGKPVRLLIKPSKETPRVQKGRQLDVAVSSLKDERGLQAAFRGVDTVIHLVTDERRGSKADFTGVDVEGTQALLHAADRSQARRIIFLSHLGADQGSAFAMLQTKSISEAHIIHSQVPYTIFRSAIIYGPGDQLTSSIVRLLRQSPGFIFLPGEGKSLLQPLWVDDLVMCIIWALENRNAENKLFSVGGGEYLTIREIVEQIMTVTGKKRLLIPLSPVYLRTLALVIEQFKPRLPISPHWLDYLASDRTCSVDTLPRTFGIIPSRFANQLNYLKGK